jgi:hypothetical protein
MNETNLTKTIMLAVSMLRGTVTFRNNTGMGWTGDSVRRPDGSVIIREARPLHAGLCKGSSDLIGWTERVITPDMVGKRVAVFTAVEIKTARGRATVEQLNFIERVRQAGGIAGIARSPEDAQNLIENL